MVTQTVPTRSQAAARWAGPSAEYCPDVVLFAQAGCCGLLSGYADGPRDRRRWSTIDLSFPHGRTKGVPPGLVALAPVPGPKSGVLPIVAWWVSRMPVRRLLVGVRDPQQRPL